MWSSYCHLFLDFVECCWNVYQSILHWYENARKWQWWTSIWLFPVCLSGERCGPEWGLVQRRDEDRSHWPPQPLSYMCSHCKKGQCEWIRDLLTRRICFSFVFFLSDPSLSCSSLTPAVLCCSGVSRWVPHDWDWRFRGSGWIRLVLLSRHLPLHLSCRILWNQQHWTYAP